MTTLTHSGSVVVGRSADDLYDMVADITRMGEWSPVCKSCWWDDGAGPEVGSWFTGKNETGELTWETRSQIIAAERGREFAFCVNGTWARWGYTFTPVDDGTELTESWEFLPDGLEFFQKHFGDDAPKHIADRATAAEHGIPATLAAIKKAAEAG
jgi:Polyketide cyclase / dehydrase and lipid transport